MIEADFATDDMTGWRNIEVPVVASDLRKSMTTSPRVPLGSTGIEVSDVFFGAGSIGGIGSSASTLGLGMSPVEGRERLDEALTRGIRVVDTANSYAAGQSERVVGEWTQAHSDVLVATKVGNIVEPGQSGMDLSAPHINRQIETSLARLGRVDLYLTHGPDPATPVVQTLEAMTALVERGAIRAFGCCNIDARGLEELLSVAAANGLQRPGWVQNAYNLANRKDERYLFPILAAERLGYTPYSPLAGGTLSDRYLHGRTPEDGSRIAVLGPEYAYAFNEETLKKVARLSKVAASYDVSTAGLALAWLRWNPRVTAPIVSPRSPAQWQAVDEALTLDLDDAGATSIAELFA
jgi:aryl-alcohol dehydrogenase-like predicted oxidoreductase